MKHIASQYQILQNDTILYDSGETTDLLEHEVTNLSNLKNNTNYIIRVRQKTDTGIWSKYAETKNVKFVLPPTTPLVDRSNYYDFSYAKFYNSASTYNNKCFFRAYNPTKNNAGVAFLLWGSSTTLINESPIIVASNTINGTGSLTSDSAFPSQFGIGTGSSSGYGFASCYREFASAICYGFKFNSFPSVITHIMAFQYGGDVYPSRIDGRMSFKSYPNDDTKITHTAIDAWYEGNRSSYSNAGLLFYTTYSCPTDMITCEHSNDNINFEETTTDYKKATKNTTNFHYVNYIGEKRYVRFVINTPSTNIVNTYGFYMP